MGIIKMKSLNYKEINILSNDPELHLFGIDKVSKSIRLLEDLEENRMDFMFFDSIKKDNILDIMNESVDLLLP